MRRTGAIIAAAGAALLLSAGTAFPRVIDGVVALVNEEPVTFSEVRESVSEGMGIPVGDADALLREERDPRAVLRWIEALVDSVLVRKELEKLGQPIAETEIDKAVESVRKANGVSEAQFNELLGKDGISLPAYRRRIRWQMERGAIVRARKYKEVMVTESEVRDYFRESGERFLVGAQVRLETLFFPIASAPSAGLDAAQARIAVQQAAEAVRAGRTFAEAEASGSRNVSQGPAPRRRLRDDRGSAPGAAAGGSPPAGRGSRPRRSSPRRGHICCGSSSAGGGRPGISPR